MLSSIKGVEPSREHEKTGSGRPRAPVLLEEGAGPVTPELDTDTENPSCTELCADIVGPMAEGSSVGARGSERSSPITKNAEPRQAEDCKGTADSALTKSVGGNMKPNQARLLAEVGSPEHA